MRILQIGGGSMGTRRIRDLLRMEGINVALFDKRKDRCKRAKERFFIPVFDDFNEAVDKFVPEALVISTPPDQHDFYIKFALDNGLHHFCESSIWTYNYKWVIEVATQKKLVSAPSNTMLFLPIVDKIKKIVDSGRIGKIQNWHMFLSTYEPGWHPGEGKEYYARNRETSAGRDMIPFELMYIDSFFKENVVSVYSAIGKRGIVSDDFEDTWSVLIKQEDNLSGSFNLIIGSKINMRSGWIAGSDGIIKFDILDGLVVLYVDNVSMEICKCGTQREVLEDTYFKEISCFIDAINGKCNWPISYKHNAEITAILGAIERSARERKEIPVDIEKQPALVW